MYQLVIGRGNLAVDLVNALNKNGTLKPSYILNSVDGVNSFHSPPSVCWLALGCGSVNEVKDDFQRAIHSQLSELHRLYETTPRETKIVVFSSDFADAPGLSSYAWIKRTLENFASHLNQKEKRVTVIRVANLYGTHRIERTFPYKMFKNNRFKEEVFVPLNHCCPTPTDWLAKTLVDNIEQILGSNQTVLTCYPNGDMTYKQWTEMIFPDKKVKSVEWDNERPTHLIRKEDMSLRMIYGDCASLFLERWPMLSDKIQSSLQPLPSC